MSGRRLRSCCCHCSSVFVAVMVMVCVCKCILPIYCNLSRLRCLYALLRLHSNTLTQQHDCENARLSRGWGMTSAVVECMSVCSWSCLHVCYCVLEFADPEVNSVAWWAASFIKSQLQRTEDVCRFITQTRLSRHLDWPTHRRTQREQVTACDRVGTLLSGTFILTCENRNIDKKPTLTLKSDAKKHLSKKKTKTLFFCVSDIIFLKVCCEGATCRLKTTV